MEEATQLSQQVALIDLKALATLIAALVALIVGLSALWVQTYNQKKKIDFDKKVFLAQKLEQLFHGVDMMRSELYQFAKEDLYEVIDKNYVRPVRTDITAHRKCQILVSLYFPEIQSVFDSYLSCWLENLKEFENRIDDLKSLEDIDSLECSKDLDELEISCKEKIVKVSEALELS